MNSNSNQASGQARPASGEPAKAGKHNKKWFIAGVVLLFAILSYLSRSYLNLDYLAEQETQLKDFYQSNPLLVYAIAFFIYVAVTGLSIPGATALSLLYAWFFDFVAGLILISFASTAGATIAFLISRYLFRDWVQTFSRPCRAHQRSDGSRRDFVPLHDAAYSRLSILCSECGDGINEN